eukprot:scaffold580_cov150-Pinguiococcus_pyrenoidosus.AAC.2
MELLVVVPESLLTMTYASRCCSGALAMAENYGMFTVWSAIAAVKLWLSSLAKSDVQCPEGDRRCGWTVLDPTASSSYQARFAIVPPNEHTTSRDVIPGNSVTLLSYVFGLGTSYRVSGVEVGPSAYGQILVASRSPFVLCGYHRSTTEVIGEWISRALHKFDTWLNDLRGEPIHVPVPDRPPGDVVFV